MLCTRARAVVVSKSMQSSLSLSLPLSPATLSRKAAAMSSTAFLTPTRSLALRTIASMVNIPSSSFISSSSTHHHHPHHSRQEQLRLPHKMNNIGLFQQQYRSYTPMTKEEEEQEKARVSHLSPDEKDAELRKLNREIARLETLKGINTGELYTWTGRYKALTREYGFPLMVYYFGVWATSGACLYFGLDILGIDAMQLIQRIDMQFGWSLASKVDPQLGKLGMVLVLNEMIEPVRLPFVIVTLKPVMDKISPPKY